MQHDPRLIKPLGFAYWVALVATVVVALGSPSGLLQLQALAIALGSLPFALLLASISSDRRIESTRAVAMRDYLTGLPGRRLFSDRLAMALAQQANTRSLMAVMFLDLDRFKLVNDTLGHPAGDRMLKAISQKLLESVRTEDFVARYGGDEFTILLENLSDENEAKLIAQRILEALSAPIKLNGHEITAGASIGIAFSNDPRIRAEELIRRADIAVYRAKALGSGRVVFYDSTLSAPIGALSLESDLRNALDRDEMCLFYQPEVDLESGSIVGFEALLRWRHPHLGLLRPEKFIQVAEEIGVIAGLGNWVLREACSQARLWQELFGIQRELKMSVNLSALEFHQDSLLADIEKILEETGLAGRHLKLEITETALMENAGQAVATLAALREQGVQVALDDFGTGCSSLSYLQRFPVDTIKIDQSFLQDIHNQRSRSIVESVITLAHSLNMDVTAEGIETTLQLQSLGLLRCDRGQGYLFAEPMDAADMASLLAANLMVGHPQVFTTAAA